MSVFGWSLPPGCGTLPGEEAEEPCHLCGHPVDDCQCSECPTCREIGCVAHLDERVLLAEMERTSFVLYNLQREVSRRGLDKYTCPKCGQASRYNPLSGDPGYCEHCQKYDYQMGEQV